MDYRINNKTLAIIPSGEHRSKVLEKKKNYEIDTTTFRVIEDSCEYFGQSYASRVKGSFNYIKVKYKSPIIIEEVSRIIFFPISSPKKSNSLWVSYNNIKEYFPVKNKRHTVIKFKNGYKLEIDSSFYSFNQQYLKASRLSAILNERIIKNS